MQKALKYTIFKTKWGYFGLAGAEYGLLRTHLPGPEPEKIKSQLLKNSSLVNRESSIQYQVSRIEFDKTFFRTTQEQIAAYFEGTRVNFSDVPIVWDYYTSTCHSRTFCHSRASGNPQTIANAKSTHVLPIQRVTEFTKQVLNCLQKYRIWPDNKLFAISEKVRPTRRRQSRRHRTC